MTAQIHDKVLFDGKEYELTGCTGGSVPEPSDFGITPVAIHTACWRGFHLLYEVREHYLFLQEMTVMPEGEEIPQINGIVPEIVEGAPYTWQNLELFVTFTGNMTLSREFDQSKYIHMGFQAPSAYGVSMELQFLNGKLVEITDVSEKGSISAENAQKAYLADPFGKKGIDEAFSLEKE
jgi:hypothetical protein